MLALNYHHLLYFATVVEERGLVPAARRLRVSHPTVSEQVHKLEDRLGLRLFERRGRRLELTEHGRMVYGYAEQIFGMGAALLDAVEGRRLGRAVTCRVGVDSVLPKLEVRRVLSPVMDELGDALSLRVTEDERDRLVDQLKARQLDVVLSDASAPSTSDRDTESSLLRSSELTLFAAPSLASRLPGIFPESLDGAPFLLPMRGTRKRRELERWMSEHRIRPRVVAEMEDSALVKAFGQDGRGVFAMPTEVEADVVAQYGVLALGVAVGVQARVFAITSTSDNVAVKVLLAQRTTPSS